MDETTVFKVQDMRPQRTMICEKWEMKKVSAIFS